jgi:hypothetical protein
MTPTTPEPRRRSWTRAALLVLRRAHLYGGLALLPWVVLYAVTAFLFNHPTAFSDQPYVSFGRSALTGTPMESPPAPADVAAQVVAALQARAEPGTTYALVRPESARYSREFAFATVKADGQDVSVLIEVSGAGGSVLSRPTPPPRPEATPAPFAVAGKASPSRNAPAKPADQLTVPDPLPERVRAAVPAVLERTRFPGGEVTVTSVPDLTFRMAAGDAVWQVTYNARDGSVSGKPVDSDEPEPPTVRRFLTRLHTASGYPYRDGPRWGWALAVDATAAAMLFWAASGLVMWWQVKAARRWGAVVFLLRAAAAVYLTVGMYGTLVR